jgi:hypothetical protein
MIIAIAMAMAMAMVAVNQCMMMVWCVVMGLCKKVLVKNLLVLKIRILHHPEHNKETSIKKMELKIRLRVYKTCSVT